MDNSDFLITSQVVIKLEKIDEKCMEIYTEIPQAIKQEPELSIKSELPEDLSEAESQDLSQNSDSGANETTEKPKCKTKKKYGPYKRKVYDTKVLCKICDIFLSSTQSYKYHFNAFHSNKPKPVFNCHLCSRTFPQNNFLLSHLRTHNEKNIYECDICGKNKLPRIRLQRHMAMHRKMMVYQCDLCPKAFKSKKYITRHVVTHIGEY